ncbi:MAG: hypothetical protein JO128_22040 [Alphaproteobacteria bacterium]|nr:hypothetical protein [Alphaproteobacteria bacterium]
MSKIVLTLFGAALMVVSTMHVARAAEHHHHLRKAHRAAVSEPFRNSNNAVTLPYGYAAPQLPSYYSGGYSAPAGQ